MTQYVYYNIADGNINRIGDTSASLSDLIAEDGYAYIEGTGSSKTHYVMNSQIVQYTDAQANDKSMPKECGWRWSNETMSYELEDADMANKAAMIFLRIKRDELLAQSDYTQMPDVTLTNQSEWDTYRQALRDLPQTYANITSLDDVTWPTPP